jgi:proteasome lid subunit RPN8/RPN11
MAEFYITRKDWDKVINYAKIAVKEFSTEIGGMMVMHKDEDGDYVLSDPVILKQEVSGSNCVLDKVALCLYYGTMNKKHKKKGANRYVWWHSHANMSAFWSPTDVKTIEGCETADFSVSLVVNVRQEYKLRVQYFHPIVIDEDVKINFIGDDKVLPVKMTEEVKALCSKPTTSVVTYGKNSKQSNMFNDYGYDDTYYYGVHGYTSRPFKGEVKKTDPAKCTWQKVCVYVDSLNTKYCSGEIKWADWKKAVKTTNKELKKNKLEWRIEIPTNENMMDSFVYTAQPEEFVTIVGEAS